MASMDTLATGIEGLRAAMAAQAEAHAEQMQSLGVKLAELDHRLEVIDAGIGQPQSMTVTTEIPAAQVSELLAKLHADVKEELSKSRPVYLPDGMRGEVASWVADSIKSGVKNYRNLLYIVMGVAFGLTILVGYGHWRVGRIWTELDALYSTTTHILSQDSRLWWDGDNFQISRQSPTAAQLKAIYDKYRAQMDAEKEGESK